MAEIHTEYNGAALSDAQIEQLHQALVADVDAMAGGPAPEPAPEPEAG